MRYPSIKTIEQRLGVNRDSARRIRQLMEGELTPYAYASVDKWRRSCYNEPRKNDPYAKLMAINEEMNAYGVERLLSSRWINDYYGHHALDYVNMGETYTPTIYYDTERDQFIVCSYGDFVESYERQKRGTFP